MSLYYFLREGTNYYCIFSWCLLLLFLNLGLSGFLFVFGVFLWGNILFSGIENINNICKVMNISSYLDLRLTKILGGKPT